MNPETQSLIDQLRDKMAGMDPQDRPNLMDRIMDGYCRYCGYETPECGICHCENDD